MRKLGFYILLPLLFALLFGCSSAPETPEEVPEETPVEEPVKEEPEPIVEPEEPPVEEPVEEPEPVVEIEPVGDEEFAVAEEAIEKARRVGAARYSPDYYKGAKEDFEEALALKAEDPDTSREYISSSVEKAEKAYQESVDSQVTEKVAKLRIMETQLIDIEAELFEPQDFQIVKDRADLLIEYLNNGQYEEADKQYHATLRAMQNLHDTLDNNIRWVKILDRDSSTYMMEAEEEEAFMWAPEELENANYSYSEGIAHFNNYNLEGSEIALKEAKYWAFQAIRLSEKRKRQNETDTLMMDALKELEKASRNKVVDDEGNIIDANPWDGDDFIDENPAEQYEAENYEQEDSSLKEYNPDAEVKDDESSMIIPGVTAVLGDEQSMSLLDQAIELWKQGVKARAQGKYDIADEYFKQSKAYSEAYSANAIADEYYVVKGDTLWGIAGRRDFMDNPFLWTKIWRRNSLTIENPDLIFPGQKIIIPPK